MASTILDAPEVRETPDQGMRFGHPRGLSTLFFTAEPVTDYVSAKTCSSADYGRFFHAMLKRGVYLAPSQFEASFGSLAMTEKEEDWALDRDQEKIKAMSNER